MSFRREAHVPRGGPDGGDGGRGGDVLLVCDASLRDLAAFSRRRRFEAGRGTHGKGANRYGADGDSLEIPVPPGTVVEMEDGSTVDLVTPGSQLVIARGGKGGRGNAHFATATRQAPRFAELGLSGDEAELELRLKLLADVGFVGLPNAGKSSLLAALTRARPKVADYPFTTLHPVLGVLDTGERQLVLADIPGLIEGASEGAGLGHDFLAHIERTRMLVHVVDLAPLDGSDPVANHQTVEAELGSHDERLKSLPRILALSKSDLVTEEEAQAAANQWGERLDAEIPIVVTSSATGAGTKELATLLARSVPELETPDTKDIVPGLTIYRPASGRGFEIDRDEDGLWIVGGRGIERLVERFDLESPDALEELEIRLRSIGVMRALEQAGFEDGDDVEIAGTVFEFDGDQEL